MKTGDKIAKLRKENNLTQDQLASLLKVSRQSVSKWESNLAYPETEKIIRISQIFNCSIDYLLNEDINEFVEKEIKTQEKVDEINEANTSSGNETAPKAKTKVIYTLTLNKLLVMIEVLIAFISFWILFAPFFEATLYPSGNFSVHYYYNLFESIKMLSNVTLVMPFVVILLSLTNFILPLIALFIPKKIKGFNIALVTISSLTIISILFLALETGNYSGSINSAQGGTIFFGLFDAAILGLSIAILSIIKKNKDSVLYEFKR